MIYFSCPNCNKVAEASDGLAGAIVTCPDCRQQMTVPRLVASEPLEADIPTAEIDDEAEAPPARPAPTIRDDGKVRFFCPTCNKRLRATRAAVGSVTVCRRCSQRMQVPAPLQLGAVPPPVPHTNLRLRSEYYFVRNNQRLGPVYAHHLKQLADAGALQPTDLIWKRGMTDWQPAAKLKGLFRPTEPPPLPAQPPPLPASAGARAPATPVVMPPIVPLAAFERPPVVAPGGNAPLPAAIPVPQAKAVGPANVAAPAALPVAPRPPVTPPAATTPVAPPRPPPPAAAPAVVPARDGERGIASWTETLRLDPRNVSARVNRGMAYAEKGDYEHAVADLTEALRLDPRNAQAYASRGVVHATMRADYARGILDLTQAIRCAPDELILYEFRALFYKAAGDPVHAAEDDRKAAELRPRGTLSNLRLGPAGAVALATAPESRLPRP